MKRHGGDGDVDTTGSNGLRGLWSSGGGAVVVVVDMNIAYCKRYGKGRYKHRGGVVE